MVQVLIGQCFSIFDCNNIWKSRNWVLTSRLGLRVGIDAVRSVLRDSRFFGLISQDVIVLLKALEGKRFPIIVTHGRWSLISSISILLVICPVSLDSKNMLSISIAVL